MTLLKMRTDSNIKRSLGVLAAGACVGMTALTAADASAGLTPHVYTYENNSVGTPAVSGTSAVIESVFASFDENNNEFTWEAVYTADTLEELPTGFTLVLNDGPMPKTHLGELAVLYFEAEEAFTTGHMAGSPTLTAYTYNGGSSASAHRTSDFRDVQSNTPAAPDKIASSLNGDFSGLSFSLGDIQLMDGTYERSVGVTFDASVILGHTPLQTPYDVMADEALTWTGIGFAEEVGIWFHPFNNINPAYGEDGYLEHGIGGTETVNDGWQVLRDNYGFFDVDNLQATTRDGLPIPEPASALLLLAGAAMIGRRQR